MKKGSFPFAKTDDGGIQLRGGLDQVTPTAELDPGACRELINWECDRLGGYRYPDGYERFDGRLAPSTANYLLIQVSAFTNTPSAGQTLTGNTSGATAYIALVYTTPSPHMIVTNISGVFTTSEVVKVGATTIGTAVPPTVFPTLLQDNQYRNSAGDYYRTQITRLNNYNPVRGIFGATFSGVFSIYALIDDDSKFYLNLWKATSAGWAQLHPNATAPYEFSFYLGDYPPDTVNGPGDDCTMVLNPGGSTPIKVARIMWEGGSWAAGTAYGRGLAMNPLSSNGGYIVNGSYGSSGGSTFSVNIVSPTTVIMHGGGTVDVAIGNVSGRDDTQLVVWTDGTNRAHVFDGTYVMPVATMFQEGVVAAPSLTARPPTEFQVHPNPLDRPTHCAFHQNTLILSIGSSIFTSAPGEIFKWTAADGASEIATGDTVTGLAQLPGSSTSPALACFGRNSTKILYGTSPADYVLTGFQSTTGALPGGVQSMEQLYVLDDRGVIGLRQAQEFGNFSAATITERVQPFIDQRRGRLTCSVLNRSKGQLRYFFEDGYALYVTLSNGEVVGISTMMFPVVMTCAWSGEDASGKEVIFTGGADGYVYQLDRGMTFDGSSIPTWMKGKWEDLGLPGRAKHYYSARLTIERGSYAALNVDYELGYGDALIPQGDVAAVTSQATTVPTMGSGTWNALYWDGGRNEASYLRLGGDAETIRYILSSNVSYCPAYTLTEIVTNYAARRRMR